MKPLNIRSLDFGGKVSICWSFFWRGILVTLGSMLVGSLLGGVLGFAIAMSGIPNESGMKVVQIVGAGVGAMVGAAFLYFYVRWLLASQLGKYRLVLVLASDASNRSPHATASGDA